MNHDYVDISKKKNEETIYQESSTDYRLKTEKGPTS